MKSLFTQKNVVSFSPFFGWEVTYDETVVRSIRNAANDVLCRIPGTVMCSEKTLNKLIYRSHNHKATLVANIFVKVSVTVDKVDDDLGVKFEMTKLGELLCPSFVRDLIMEASNEVHLAVEGACKEVRCS